MSQPPLTLAAAALPVLPQTGALTPSSASLPLTLLHRRDFLLVTFAALLLLTCCPLGLLVSVFLVVADLCSQLVLNLLSGVPIDASSSFLLGVAVGAAGSVRRAWGRWRRGSRADSEDGVAAGAAS